MKTRSLFPIEKQQSFYELIRAIGDLPISQNPGPGEMRLLAIKCAWLGYRLAKGQPLHDMSLPDENVH